MSGAAYQENAADPRELELGEELAAQDARDQLRADREQLSTYAGRAWVWGELEAAGLFRDISGPIETVYAALGARRPGLRLMVRCQQHPEFFFQMWSEALKRRRERREYVSTTRTRKKQQQKSAA